MTTNPPPTTPPDPFAKGETPEELKKVIDAIPPLTIPVLQKVDPRTGDLSSKG